MVRQRAEVSVLPQEPVAQLPLPFDPDKHQHFIAQINPLDAQTGEVLDSQEILGRAHILLESENGFYAVDKQYDYYRVLLRGPLRVTEDPEFIDGVLNIQQSKALFQVRLESPDLPPADILQMQQFGMTVAQKVVGEAAARLMQILYEIANDPPYWRRREITVRISDLMDRMGYRKDNNGYHRAANRRHLCQTLLALHWTNISVQRSESGGRSGVKSGTMGPLFSALRYRASDSEETSDLTQMEIFQRGLPAEVTIVINEEWYGLRNQQGRLTQNYLLMPNTRETYKTRRGKRDVAERLHRYINEAFATVGNGPLTVTVASLCYQADLTDSNASRRLAKLTQHLAQMVKEGLISSFTTPTMDRYAEITIKR